MWRSGRREDLPPGHAWSLRKCPVHSPSSTWRLRTGQKAAKVIIDARHPKIRFTLEGAAQIVHSVIVAILELNQCKDEVVRLVETGEDFVLGHGHGVYPRH